MKEIEYSAIYLFREVKHYQTPQFGYFHRFGDEVIIKDEKNFSQTYGIVEDATTGQIFKVPIEKIKFIK